MPTNDDPRNRKSSLPTAEEEFASLPRWKQSRANKQELQEGWPVYIPPESFSTGRAQKGHRFFREQPKTDLIPQFGPDVVDKVLKGTIREIASFLTTGHRAGPDPLGDRPLGPQDIPTTPNPAKAQHFRDAVRRLEEAERTPQLKVRPSKKG